MTNSDTNVFNAWGLPTRLFHWINFLCIVILSILGLIMFHINAVIRAKNGGQGTLISAMFNGKKHLPRPPADEWGKQP